MLNRCLLWMGIVALAGCQPRGVAVSWTPKGPSDIRAVAAVEGAILEWAPVADADHYDVLIEPGSQRINAVSSPWRATGLDAGVEYTFVVVAIPDGGGIDYRGPAVHAVPLPFGVPGQLPSTTSAWTLESDVVNGQLGADLGSAGDVNNDGYDDLLIGAHTHLNTGAAWVYSGGASGISAAPTWQAPSVAEDGSLGGSVAALGDINGDGFNDIGVASAGFDTAVNGVGRGMVFYGEADGPAATPTIVTQGAEDSDANGWPVTGRGDINGDGYGDVFMGCPRCDNEGAGIADTGAAQIFFGSASGLQPVPWVFQGDLAASQMPYRAVSIAGDVNDDGYSDLLLASRFYDTGGRACVFLGGPSGPVTTPSWVVDGTQIGGDFGGDAHFADVNGDGFTDVVVASHNYDNPENNEGAVFAYYGSDSGISTLADWSAESDVAGAQFGLSVAPVDVNGDGFDDLLVGSPGEARAYLFLGSSTGLAAAPVWSTAGEQPNGAFGNFLENAGDVNGDDHDDILIAEHLYANPEAAEGKVRLYLAPAGQGPSASAATMSFSDPMWDETHSCTLSWGEGDETTFPCTSEQLAATTHTYSGPGTYLVRLRVTNSAGVYGESASIVSVSSP